MQVFSASGYLSGSGVRTGTNPRCRVQAIHLLGSRISLPWIACTHKPEDTGRFPATAQRLHPLAANETAQTQIYRDAFECRRPSGHCLCFLSAARTCFIHQIMAVSPYIHRQMYLSDILAAITPLADIGHTAVQIYWHSSIDWRRVVAVPSAALT